MDTEVYKVQPKQIDVRSIVDAIQATHRCRVEVSFHADKSGISVFFNGNRVDYRGEVIWPLGGPREGTLGYYQEQFEAPVQPTKLIYEVLSGRSTGVLAAFASFDLARAYYRGYCEAARRHNERSGLSSYLPRIVNTERADGSEDGNESGLSEDERNAIDEIG